MGTNRSNEFLKAVQVLNDFEQVQSFIFPETMKTFYSQLESEADINFDPRDPNKVVRVYLLKMFKSFVNAGDAQEPGFAYYHPMRSALRAIQSLKDLDEHSEEYQATKERLDDFSFAVSHCIMTATIPLRADEGFQYNVSMAGAATLYREILQLPKPFSQIKDLEDIQMHLLKHALEIASAEVSRALEESARSDSARATRLFIEQMNVLTPLCSMLGTSLTEIPMFNDLDPQEQELIKQGSESSINGVFSLLEQQLNTAE